MRFSSLSYLPFLPRRLKAESSLLDPSRVSDTRSGLARIIFAWAFGSIFFNVIMGAPLASYVRSLGGSDFTWGIIAAAPMIGSVSQVFGSCWIERTRDRKRHFLTYGMIQRLLWIPIALLPWVFPKGHPVLLPSLITLALASSLCGHLAGPAWLSWMADFVPLQVRGAFFASRLRVGTLMALISSTLAGWWLDVSPGLMTYTLLFVMVSLCGVVDVIVFRWVPEPEMPPDEECVSFAQMLRAPFEDPVFRRFVAYVMAFLFSLHFMMAPLWMFAMEELGMGKLAANLSLMGAQLAAMALASPFWGRLADRFGNRPVLKVCTAGVTLLTIPWLFMRPETANWVWLISLLTGVFWSGIELGNFSLMLSLAPKERRSVTIGMFAMTAGIAAGLAPVISGALVDLLKALPPVQFAAWTPGPYRIVILLSLLGRLLSIVVFLPRVREPRATSTRELLQSVKTDLEERIALHNREQ